jgi:hypothetical protein
LKPSRRVIELQIASDLAADPQAVLAHVGTLAGVNQELRPIFTMTAPRSFRGRSLFQAPVGRPLFRSWLLLGGVVPVDFDHLTFESVDPASGFVESSTMLTMATWRHERRVTARAPSGTRIVDRLAFTPRVPGTGRALASLVERLFLHRHARLRALFGTAAVVRPGG